MFHCILLINIRSLTILLLSLSSSSRPSSLSVPETKQDHYKDILLTTTYSRIDTGYHVHVLILAITYMYLYWLSRTCIDTGYHRIPPLFQLRGREFKYSTVWLRMMGVVLGVSWGVTALYFWEKPSCSSI